MNDHGNKNDYGDAVMLAYRPLKGRIGWVRPGCLALSGRDPSRQEEQQHTRVAE